MKSAGLDGKKILFVTDKFDETVYRTVRNIAGVEFILSRNMNAYEVLRADVLVFTREALANLEEVFA
jgi:large subunit ribosomal protein L4